MRQLLYDGEKWTVGATETGSIRNVVLQETVLRVNINSSCVTGNQERNTLTEETHLLSSTWI